MTHQTIEQAVEEMPTNKCPVCDGDGCTVEHDPNDPTGQTPIQVQCDFCHAEGKIITLDCARKALQAQRDAGARDNNSIAIKAIEGYNQEKIELTRMMREVGNQEFYLQTEVKNRMQVFDSKIRALTPPIK